MPAKGLVPLPSSGRERAGGGTERQGSHCPGDGIILSLRLQCPCVSCLSTLLQSWSGFGCVQSLRAPHCRWRSPTDGPLAAGGAVPLMVWF